MENLNANDNPVNQPSANSDADQKLENKPPVVLADTVTADTQDSQSAKIPLTDYQKEEFRALFKEDLEKLKTNSNKQLKKESHELKKDFLTIFGVFVTFLTFMSIEVQLFKVRKDSLELIGVSTIVLSFLMLFSTIIYDIVKNRMDWKNMKKFPPTYVLAILFLIIGTIMLFNKNNNCHENQMAEIIHCDGLKVRSHNYNDSIIISSLLIKIDSLQFKFKIFQDCTFQDSISIKGLQRDIDSLELKFKLFHYSQKLQYNLNTGKAKHFASHSKNNPS